MYPHELVVLGDTIGPGGRTAFELPGAGPHDEIRDETVFGLA